MSSRLSEIETRTASATQLDAVIGAMRGIAAAREREAQARLAGIRSAAATVGEAIGMVLAAAPPARAERFAPPENAARILIVVCTEQGFVGGFNEHLLARAERLKAHEPGEVFIVGTRGTMLAQERALRYGWSVGMAAHAQDVVRVAGQVADAVFARFSDEASSQVWLVHATPGPVLDERIVTRRLVPFDFTRFEVPSRGQAPLLNLPLDKLLTGLTERYVYLELCDGLMQSFAAENAARVAAMLAASRHVKDRLQALTRDYRIVRQDEITAEIAELAATGACAPAAAAAGAQP
ncbi:F0F1 ATP synthase subunit gamma [Paraburkholderia sp. MMS20-SJTN17]|uniref:F0F1 ATP synthase subunit gamma n=1 Tax=Paraburkholderia translucens TaxID=2886945 RepID=A0ABS8KJD2_9BURK|nr:F0F1 ATP synthase subunit gamma [Paraburkholderia sp. MMS20-SJTN17]MCC8404876.1 F0F1 ATP synthase subunit gamma [Paraburkholderia sp. MMS20-SJTN17]